jgi:hypothetical protein
VDIHSYDDLMYCIMYTKNLPFSPYLYSDSIEMSSSSNILSTLSQLDLYACNAFPPIAKLPTKPRLDSEIFSASKDTSSVVVKN